MQWLQRSNGFNTIWRGEMCTVCEHDRGYVANNSCCPQPLLGGPSDYSEGYLPCNAPEAQVRCKWLVVCFLKAERTSWRRSWSKDHREFLKVHYQWSPTPLKTNPPTCGHRSHLLRKLALTTCAPAHSDVRNHRVRRVRCTGTVYS